MPREILDVAVAAVLTGRDRANGLFRRLLQLSALHMPENDAGRIWRQRERWHAVGIGFDQRRFPFVPLGQKLMRRRAADDARVRNARKPHSRDMARCSHDAMEVPDRLARLREYVGQEAAAVLGGENARVSPLVSLDGADIEDVDDQKVPRLGAFYLDGTAEVVARQQVAVAHILGIIVVSNLATGPIQALDAEIITR